MEGSEWEGEDKVGISAEIPGEATTATTTWVRIEECRWWRTQDWRW